MKGDIFMINEVELSQKFAEILSTSRISANLSQAYMARTIGKSKNTICNWESGIGLPNCVTLFRWFEICGVSPQKYILDTVVFPKETHCGNDDMENEAFLLYYIKNIATEKEKEQLVFNIKGNTGSSWLEQLNMLSIDNCCSLRSRANIAQVTLDNYKMEKANNQLSIDSDIVDVDSLEQAIDKGKQAVLNQKNRYH